MKRRACRAARVSHRPLGHATFFPKKKTKTPTEHAYESMRDKSRSPRLGAHRGAACHIIIVWRLSFKYSEPVNRNDRGNDVPPNNLRRTRSRELSRMQQDNRSKTPKKTAAERTIVRTQNERPPISEFALRCDVTLERLIILQTLAAVCIKQQQHSISVIRYIVTLQLL